MNQRDFLPRHVSAPLSLAMSVIACCFFTSTGPLHAQITFDWATVGNPGNLPDQLSTFNNPENLQFGAVANTYRISKFEVTNDQYAEFLNSVDPMGTNPNDIYHSEMRIDVRGGISFDARAASGSKYSTKTNMANKPVNWVSFFDAMRFTNWLENGQPTDGSGTETGVYAISDGVSETRAPGATFFIPSEDESYKAAYHQPAVQGGDTDNYWLYPTASNSVPTIATANAVGDISNPGPNVANYQSGADWNMLLDGNVTTVGSAGPFSASFYGTFDQGGNVWEWNEAVLGSSSSFRGLRGGEWSVGSDGLAAAGRFDFVPAGEGNNIGFRVASIVPEPGSVSLAAIGLLGMLTMRRRSLCRENTARTDVAILHVG